MNMNYTFNANEVQCNGVGGYGYQAARKCRDLIEKIVVEVRDELGLDKIYQMAVEKETYKNQMYAGSRFHDVGRVTDRLVSGLAAWAFNKFGDAPELIEMNIKHNLETITKQGAITLVIEAHRDCAGADHWYTFEKEWD